MKVQNWPNIVVKGIRAHRDIEFVWGVKDCCLAVADIVKDYTGNDFAAEFRGKYATAIGSVRALKKYGKGSIGDTLDTKYPRLSASELPCRGDLALVKTDAGESLGIVYCEAVWAMSLTGMVDLPMSDITAAWRVE